MEENQNSKEARKVKHKNGGGRRGLIKKIGGALLVVAAVATSIGLSLHFGIQQSSDSNADSDKPGIYEEYENVYYPPLSDRNLTHIEIPEGYTSIGNYVFYDCSNLQSITIPNSVTSIGYNAFTGCYNLQSITIPNSVTSIGEGAFAYCRNLQSITIPDSVTSIGDGVFHGCDSLTSVTIPDSVTSIGDYAFMDCDSLTSITIPDSVISIGDEALGDCDNLNTVNIPKHLTEEDGWEKRVFGTNIPANINVYDSAEAKEGEDLSTQM